LNRFRGDFVVGKLGVVGVARDVSEDFWRRAFGDSGRGFRERDFRKDEEDPDVRLCFVVVGGGRGRPVGEGEDWTREFRKGNAERGFSEGAG
jgi:hypothetical protein